MKNIIALLFAFFALVACTDYGADYEDKYKNLLATCDEEDSSSSLMERSSSSSSEKKSSSSSAKTSSSSSSVKSSSSIVYGTVLDSRDNQIYKTVTIGSQTWMAENLNYSYHVMSAQSFCYNNDVDNCDKYGRLYTWSAAMDSAAVFSTAGKGCGYGKACGASGFVRGACPEGWHLPSQAEWSTLFTAVSRISSADTMLKSTSGWNGNGNGENSYGFSVLPAGYCNGDGSDFANEGFEAYFWNSTEHTFLNAYNCYFYYFHKSVFEYSSRKNLAFSVRCVKNFDDDGASSSSLDDEKSSSSSAKEPIPSSSSESGSSSLAESSSSEIIALSSSSLAESSSSEVVASSSSSLVESSSSINNDEDDSSSSMNKSSSSNEDIVSSSSIEYGTLTDSRDNQTYKTVTIGEQTWMAENLNYAYLQPTVEEDSSSFCYNNSADSCSKYGRLYLWSAAMDSAAIFSTGGKGCGYGATCSASGTNRGVCPEGWHLPSSTEWFTLFTAVGGTSTAGTVLKSTSGWYSSGNGEDSYGFSVLPAGNRDYSDFFETAGYSAYFWSSTERNSLDAYGWSFYCHYAYVFENYSNKYYAFSVRCIKD